MKYEKQFRIDHPETVGETDSHFDLDNYKDWLEARLDTAEKLLKELHSNVLYRISEEDDRPTHAPHYLFDKVDSFLTNKTE